MALNHQGVYVVVDYKLGIMETRFAELIWNREPITSGELVKLCERELEWKKSTTYTMLRRLCQRNIFQNKDGMVTAILSKQEFHAAALWGRITARARRKECGTVTSSAWHIPLVSV